MDPVKDNGDENGVATSFYNRPAFLVSSLLIIILAVSVMAAYALHEIRSQKSKEIENTLTTILNTTHEALVAWADDHIDDLQYWATRPDVKEIIMWQLLVERKKAALLASPHLRELRHAFHPVLEDHGHLGFFIVSPDYINIASLRDENVGAINLLAGEGDYLKRLFSGKEIMTTPLKTDVPLKGEGGELSMEEATMFIGVPVLDESEKVIAALLIRIDPSVNFTRIAKLGRIGETGETYLVDRDGILISESRFDAQLVKTGLVKKGGRGILKISVRDPGVIISAGDLSPIALDKQPLTLMAESVLKGEKGANLEGYRDYRGVTVVGTWLWDPIYDLGMTTEIDFDEAFSNYHFTRNLLVMVLLFTLTLFLLLYAVVMKSRKEAVLLKREAERYVKETNAANEMLELEVAERKLAQDDLWQERNFISTVLDSAAALVVVLDMKGRIVRFNRACEALTGYSFDEMEDEYVWDKLLPPDQVAGVRNVFDELRFEAMPNKYENSWVTKDGRRPLIAWSNSVIKSRNGGVAYIVAVGIDVTEKRAAERALFESRESLQRAQAIAHIGNWEWEVETGKISWSDEIFKIFGHEPRSFEPTYQAFLNTIHPDDRDLVAGCVAEALKKEKSYSIDHRIVLPDGRERIVHEQGEVEFNEDGRAVKMIGAVQDITELKETEKEIEILAKFPSENPFPVMQLSSHGAVLYFNEASKPILDVWGGKEEGLSPVIKSFITDIYEKGKSREVEVVHGNKVFSITVIPINESEYLYVYGLDITYRKQVEDDLKKAKELADIASNAKSEFLANMSHEIRTPMTSIIGMAELLSESKLTNKEQDYVNRLKNSGDALLGIINDILDLSKIEAGRIDLEEIDFNVAEEIEKIISIYEVSACEKGIRLSKAISADVPLNLRGDPARLRQVLVNLIGNAIKFTNSGEIMVDVKMNPGAGESILFVVTDSGIGIAADKLETIFEEFSQADNSTTRTHGGTGLGLTISKKLVELMGGRMSVESAVGRGASFQFTVKMKEGSGKKAGTKKEKKSNKNKEERVLRILLVDDSEDNRLLIQTFMKDSPHSLDMAANGEEAFEKFMINGYDLLLMDMQMPVMDGYEATRVIRRWEGDKKMKETPIIAFTAHALKEEVQKCLDAGCNDHLAKPVKKKELIERISSYAV